MDAFGLMLNVNNFGCEVGFGCEVFEILAGCRWLWVVFAGSGWFGSFLLLVCTKALQFSQTQSENDSSHCMHGNKWPGPDTGG